MTSTSPVLSSGNRHVKVSQLTFRHFENTELTTNLIHLVAIALQMRHNVIHTGTMNLYVNILARIAVKRVTNSTTNNQRITNTTEVFQNTVNTIRKTHTIWSDTVLTIHVFRFLQENFLTCLPGLVHGVVAGSETTRTSHSTTTFNLMCVRTNMNLVHNQSPPKTVVNT